MKSVAPIQKQPEKATTNIIVDSSQRSWWNSLSDGQRKFIATLSVILGVSIISLIAFYFIRRQIRNIRSNNVQNKSFGSDKHSTWAKQFQMAFENDSEWSWGTDEKLIRQTLKAIPTREDFKKVSVEYKSMTKGRNLVGDLSSELSSSEYQEMLAIITSKPKTAKDAKPASNVYYEGWAKRLHSAVNYHYWGGIPGTDDDAIVAVFQEFPNQLAFYGTAKAYRKLYGVSLWTDLDGDLNWSMDWRAMLKRKPKK